MSLRRRLLVGLVAVAAVLVVTNVVLAGIFESFLLDRVDRQLVAVTGRPAMRRPAGPAGGRPGPPPGEGAETLSEYYIAVGTPDGSTFVRVASAFSSSAAPRLDATEILGHAATAGAPPVPFTTGAASGPGRWRLVAVQGRNGAVTVVGLDLAGLNATVRRVRSVQVFGTIAVLSALGLVSWWVVRLGVHPIEDMAEAADSIAGGDLDQRVAHPPASTEAGRLGVALNAMLDRIQDAFRAREESEQRVRRFAADASHELRTPLTSIQGYAELWRAGGLRDEDALADAMRRIEQEANRMGALVEDLLVLARLDQGRPLDATPVRLDVLVADAVRDARAVEPDRDIELTTEEVTVTGDELRLRQVVANLLANVRSHTPVTAAVRVSVATEDGTAVVTVADEGPGMTPDVAAHVLERFYRADASRSRDAGGAGLGLSIVDAIVEAHGGAVTVESEPGRGSRFAVRLPPATRS
ncbi:MAG TPA: HAMP domain-containing sensor histidine kinase [Acidimicrobiales bacterium]|nr:HAMP domain-containing sensor histidine kinase [Acidimicrobiales bacterium]